MDICVSLLQATLGGTIQVPTLTGDVVVKVWFQLPIVFVGNIGISYRSEMSERVLLIFLAKQHLPMMSWSLVTVLLFVMI